MIAAIYARKSTDQQGVSDDAKSVTVQIERAHAYAATRGWSTDDAFVFDDDGISGAEFANRPGFVRLMRSLKPRPAFQVLVMSEESRLGRERIETAYALKQLIAAGVRVFFYLEDRERTLDSPTDKIMLSLTTFADELEREKARQRTYDALSRKARAGQIVGGRLFGYTNVDVVGPDGKRSHVTRVINECEAAVIRRVFHLSVTGHGVKAIAKILNAEGAPSPRAQRDRSQSWSPSSVREVLFRETYRGVVMWNRTRKRDRWGIQKQTSRPASEWLRRDTPELRIVAEEMWAAAHARLAAVRGVYLAATNGRPFGRPPLGDPSKYLLTNLALCGCCGGSMRVRSRSHGTGRKFYYGCSGYHERGRTVCGNGADAPMDDVNDIVIEALLDEVLDKTIINAAVSEALRELRGDGGRGAKLITIERELATVEHERTRLVESIATGVGGTLDVLVQALAGREERRKALETTRAALRSERHVTAAEAEQVHRELLDMASSWRQVLGGDPAEARPIITSLLKGRVTIAPGARAKEWTLTGEGTLAGLFQRVIFPSGWRPKPFRVGTKSTPSSRP